MKQPFILLGPQGSGKTFLAHKMADLVKTDDTHLLHVKYENIASITSFKVGGLREHYHTLIIEEIPDEESLYDIYPYLKGLSVGSGIHPVLIFTSSKISDTTPMRGFVKIICSYHLHQEAFNKKYNVQI